jgi:hypothetical protein
VFVCVCAERFAALFGLWSHVLAFAVDWIYPSALRLGEERRAEQPSRAEPDGWGGESDAVVGPMVQVINLVEAAIATPALTQSGQSRAASLLPPCRQHFWACANTRTLMPETALHELCSTVIARELQLFVR